MALGRRSFLGIGPDAPKPSGEFDPELKNAMIAESRSRAFVWRVSLWSRMAGYESFDWDKFGKKLQDAEYRSFATWIDAAQSIGWSGTTTHDETVWLFGVAGYYLPLIGSSIMRHELFHAAQDVQYGLFHKKPGFMGTIVAEYAAHFWGGPLIGVPIVYGGTLAIVISVMLVLTAVFGIR